MPFSSLKLHPALLKGIKELGFARPTPIQAEAIPPALDGRDVLACAADRQRQDRRVSAADPAPADRRAARHDARAGARADARAGGADPRGSRTTSPSTRRSPAPPCSAASAWGRRSTRSGAASTSSSRRRAACSITCARRTRSSTRSNTSSSTKRTACSTWASSRTSAASSGYIPAKRQTLFFSATMPPPIVTLTGEMLQNPATIQLRAARRRPRSASRRRSIRCRRS